VSRNRYLDLLKGILIITVVVGHVIQYFYYKNDYRFFSDLLFKAIYLWHMPLFMGVAGYLSWNGIKRDPWPKLAWTKFKAYIVPIFAWAMLFSAVKLAVYHKMQPGLWLSEVTSGTFGDFWFLWALYLSILFTSLVRLVGRWYKVAYVILPCLFLLLPDVWHLALIKYVLPFFMLGCLLAEQGIPAFAVYNRTPLLLVSILATVICFWAWRDTTYVYLSGSLVRPFNANTLVLRYVAGLCGSASVLLFVSSIWEAIPRYLSRCVETFGRDSIYIYLIQGYLIIAANHLVSRISTSSLNIYSRSAGAIVLSFVICVGLWAFSALIARSEILAQVLFGKWKAPAPTRTRVNPPPRILLKPHPAEPPQS